MYTLIGEGRHGEAVQVLDEHLDQKPGSRPALSLLGHSLFHCGQHERAASVYDELASKHGNESEAFSYRLYHAFCLYRSGQLNEASASLRGVRPGNEASVHHLETLIALAHSNSTRARRSLAKCSSNAASTIVNSGCILFKEDNFDLARERFSSAIQLLGNRPDLLYNIALCNYKTRNYSQAVAQVNEIIELGMREHPELNVGSYTTGMEVRSVGNSQTLQDTALVEAFNLKAAIEFLFKNHDAAKETMTDMPPRTEEELDPVTLHNMALMHMDTDPTCGFNRFNHLLSQPPFPPETFRNLLILYCQPQHEFYDLAADVMAENPVLVQKHLESELRDFLDALTHSQRAPEEAFRKLDAIASTHVENLRRLTKGIQDARLQGDNERVQRALNDFNEALEHYIPVLSAMARIYWEREQYNMVERILRQSAAFCSDHDIWKLNLAHTFFVQDEKYEEAIRYYVPIVNQNFDNLLNVTAIVLANLCVSYIMTSQNEEAEEIMRRIAKEEETQALQQPEKPSFHLCIVNLVIGTLYCTKGNFEFGLNRVIKALEPYDQKLQADTWYYAKRCFVAFVDSLAKHMLVVSEETTNEVLAFLDEAERFGKRVRTRLDEADRGGATPTVSSEARALKQRLIKLQTY